jgi:nitroreductase
MKETEISAGIIESIRTRKSIHAFSDQPVAKEDMQLILEAGTWAPSASNEQPWIYIYAFKDTPGFKKIWNCLVPANQAWTKDAAVLLVSIARKNIEKNGKPNRHYMHDCGLANENMLLQAVSMNIYGHPMAGFEMEKTIGEFSISDNEEVVCFIAFGYQGDPAQLEEPNKSRETAERSRKDVTEVSTDISH